jgi:hypothetical protein
MATNVYFNNFSPAVINEQRLLEDLVVESIKMHGHDVQYLPREAYDSTDEILGESPQAKFSRAYNVEMYLANVEGYEGDGDFFSKFGLEIRDTSNFVVSRRSFERFIPSSVAKRPREGDLIFVPVLQKIFEIKFVEEELLFFSLGKRNPYMYELRCEVFRFSQEDLDTGIQEIDDLERALSFAIHINVNGNSNDFIIGERVYQGINYETATWSGEVRDWDRGAQIVEVINVRGDLKNSEAIDGTQSGATWLVINNDELSDHVDYDEFDNRKFQTEADTFMDLTESNPFGQP